MGAPPQFNIVLTDRLLRSWIKCRRKAWLDQNGDQTKRVWTAHRSLQLQAQHQSFTSFLTDKPKRGLLACERGEEGVIGLRLKGKGPESEQVLEVHPSLLQKIKGNSCWGKFAYRPVLAQQGRKLTRELRLIISLQAILLEALQESPVTEGITVRLQKDYLKVETIFITKILRRQVIEALRKLKIDLVSTKAPPLTSDRRKCNLCSWRDVCDLTAKTEGHLSEISGIGGRRLQMLHEVGVYQTKDLAVANADDLSEKLKQFGEQHQRIASKLITQAKVQNSQLEQRLIHDTCLPELNNAPGLLFYDIESDPDLQEDFLHGFLHVTTLANQQLAIKSSKYHPLLVIKEHGDKKYWNRLRRKLLTYPDWPILHYGETESLSLCKLAKHQGASDEELISIRNRLIDVHKRLTSFWCLPLNSYSLKTVANWLEFSWHKEHLDGSRALLWWRQWKSSEGTKSSKNKLLKRIFKYNLDDCMATYQVAKWLFKKDKELLNKNI